MSGLTLDGRETISEVEILDPNRITHLLRSGFALAILAGLAEVAQTLFIGPSRARVALPYDLVNLAACLACAAFSYRQGFERHWKPVALVFCLFVVGATTAGGTRLGEQVPLFVTILVLATATCALPWEPEWQAGLTAGFLAAAMADTLIARPMSTYIGLLWLATLITCALAIVSNRLAMQHRITKPDRGPQDEARLLKVFDADVSHLSLTQFRGGSFVQVNQDLLANLSHELRTSLNAIMGMAELLAESPLTPDQRRFVDSVAINGTSLLDVINVILDLSKVESGRLRLQKKEFELDEVIHQVAETVQARAHEKGLELAIRIRPGVPLSLRGDPIRLRQVMLNLLDNAVKFTAHGEIVLAVENDQLAGQNVGLRFSVRDTGMGIAPGRFKAIFQPFTQGESSIGRDYGGTGLGLAIAKRLVELMGGQIAVESARGKGSTFYFTALFGVRSDSAKQGLPRDVKLGGLRVLVVGDNDTNRSIVSEILGDWGAEVVEADGSDYAIGELRRARAAGNPHRLVLLDSRTPATDGFAVAQRIMREFREREPMVLMLTSDDLNAKLARLRELAIDAYVVKPVKRSELFQAIGIAMGASRAAEETPAPPAPELPFAERSLRILLADDSPHNRLLIKQYLKDLPIELDVTENGAVAVERFACARYDLVLMDLRMPVMDGLEAARRMRLHELNENRAPTPIVALSASVLEEDIRDSMEAGCNAHLSKPVRKSRLLAVVRELAGVPTAPPSNGDGSSANGNGTKDAVEAAPHHGQPA